MLPTIFCFFFSTQAEFRLEVPKAGEAKQQPWLFDHRACAMHPFFAAQPQVLFDGRISKVYCGTIVETSIDALRMPSCQKRHFVTLHLAEKGILSPSPTPVSDSQGRYFSQCASYPYLPLDLLHCTGLSRSHRCREHRTVLGMQVPEPLAMPRNEAADNGI